MNGIAPGLVASEAAVEWWSSEPRKGIQDLLIGGQMIKRLGRMDDLADMARFLCSSQASFATGQTILVDGGHTRKPV